ncbi:MAG: hypothetical protein AB1589_13540 [Cyanobacteriota bacterium]
MVILEKTKTQLKLRHRPYSVWLITASWMLAILLVILFIRLQNSWLIYLWWMPLFLVLNLVACSLVLIFAGQVVTYHFDQDYNSLTIKRCSLLNTKVVWHSLGDIWDVQVKSTHWHQDKNADYQIAIVLKEGKTLPLNIVPSSDVQKNLEAVNLIRDFLRMPPQKLS